MGLEGIEPPSNGNFLFFLKAGAVQSEPLAYSPDYPWNFAYLGFFQYKYLIFVY